MPGSSPVGVTTGAGAPPSHRSRIVPVPAPPKRASRADNQSLEPLASLTYPTSSGAWPVFGSKASGSRATLAVTPAASDRTGRGPTLGGMVVVSWVPSCGSSAHASPVNVRTIVSAASARVIMGPLPTRTLALGSIADTVEQPQI